MARVKRGVTSHAKHKKVLKAVKGQRIILIEEGAESAFIIDRCFHFILIPVCIKKRFH